MKRLFVAVFLSLALHGLLSTIRFEGPGATLTQPPRRLTLSLADRPTEKLPAPADSSILEPPVRQPSHRPQPDPEKTRPQKAKKIEKSVKRIIPSLPPRREPAGPFTDPPVIPAQEAPLTGTSQQSAFPAGASLGGEGLRPAPVPAREAAPLYRLNPVPEYPWIARKRGYQGTVILDVLVSREGSVSELRVSASSGYALLDQAALRSVRRWLFEPGMKGGEKVDMWVRVPVRFQLD